MRTIDLTGHVLAHVSPLVLESSLDICTVYIAASSMCLNYPSRANNFFEDLSKKRLIAVFHVQEVQYSSTTSHTACKSQHAAILLTNPTAVFGKVEFKKKLWADCEFTRVRTRSRLPLCVCVWSCLAAWVCCSPRHVCESRPVEGGALMTVLAGKTAGQTSWLDCAVTSCFPCSEQLSLDAVQHRGGPFSTAPLLNFLCSLSSIQTDVIEKQHFWIGKLAFEMENKFEKTSRDGSPQLFFFRFKTL